MKYQSLGYVVASVVVLLAFQNCGNNAQISDPQAPAVEKFEGEAKGVVGDWAQACENSTSAGVSYSTRLKMQIQNDGTFRLETANYSGAGCATHLMSMAFGGNVEAKPGDILFGALDTILLTIGHADLVKQYNKAKICGREDWKVGVAMDLKGLNCQDATYTETVNGTTTTTTIRVSGVAAALTQLPIAIKNTPFSLENGQLVLDGFTMNGKGINAPFTRL